MSYLREDIVCGTTVPILPSTYRLLDEKGGGGKARGISHMSVLIQFGSDGTVPKRYEGNCVAVLHYN